VLQNARARSTSVTGMSAQTRASAVMSLTRRRDDDETWPCGRAAKPVHALDSTIPA
jgi:hypothetical protein